MVRRVEGGQQSTLLAASPAFESTPHSARRGLAGGESVEGALQKQVHGLQRQAQVVAAIVSSTGLSSGLVSEIARQLSEEASEAVESDRVEIWLLSDSDARLTSLDAYRRAAAEHSSGAVVLHSQYVDEFAAFAGERCVSVEDVSADARLAGWVDSYLKPNRIGSILDVGIRVGGRIVGVLRFAQDKARKWADDETHFACQLADLMAIAVENRDRNAVEAELRRNDTRFRMISENLVDVIWTMDPRTNRFTYVSPSVLRLRGYTAEEVMAASMQDALTPESFARVQAVLREWLTEAQSGSEGRSDVIELDQRCKDGSIVHTEIVAVYARGPDGSTEVIGVTRDITARKAAEAALLESEERFRRLFRQHSAVKLVMDSQSGQILDANDAAAEFYGWSVQELCRMNIAQINTLPPELIAFELGTVSESKKGKRFEFRHRRADGSIRDVESFSNTIESGGKTYVYSIVHDVTERKRAQEEKEKLEAQNRRMQRTASLGRMAGAIAHNFNNQLQGVIGNLELVLTEGRGTRGQFEYEDCVREALNAAQQAANVSRLLLAYLGQAPMEFERVDLSEACTKNISMLRAFIPEDFELDLRFASTELTVYANAAHLQQVLTNLVANAWESYAARRGKISLRFSEAKADEIATKHRFPIDSTLQDSTYACIEVSDSGCGIAEKEIENIFDPFYSSKFTGRGMGLPVVLGVLRSHRGVVTVESTVGKGSTFRVYLPLACDPT